MKEGAITLTVVSFLKPECTEWVYEHILKEKPDVILFQKVSNSNVLELAKKLRKLDYQYKVANEGRTDYELICSKWPILYHKFNRYSTSEKGCGVLWADLKINSSTVTVASTQLDQDPEDHQKRLGQLDCVLKFLANHHHTIIVGCNTGFQKNEAYDLQRTRWKDARVASGNNNGTERAHSNRIYYQGPFSEPVYESVGNSNIKLMLQYKGPSVP